MLTTWDKQCEHNLLANLPQDVRFWRVLEQLNAKIILFQIQRIPGAVSSVRLQ